MRTKLLVLLTAAVLLLPSPSAAQIGQTGTLTGTVADQSGAVLPGVTVTATGESVIGGARTAVTDENGVYRFPSLPPGTYTVSAELSGFRPFSQENVRLQLGQTLTVDARLEVGGFQDRVTVAGGAPIVDVKAASAQKNLTAEQMENIPFTSRFGPGAMLAAPGVSPTTYSAYGGGGQSSNAYMVDGVDVSDPESGTIWLFSNHNWIQEVQVIGLGASAEYGGFTGVASNSLFRSGSNVFRGLFETLYENDALTGNNVSDELIEENEFLTPGSTEYITDTTVQIGGPIKRDKLWFFTSFQYYRPKTKPASFPPIPPDGYTVSGIGPQARLEKSPRFLFKPTVKIGQNDTLTGFFESDSYTVDGRNAGAFSNGDVYSTESTLHQDSPEVSWNANFTKVLSASSVFDVKYSGFWGYYYLTPYNGDTPGWYDVDEQFYAVNSYYFYNADRVRHQANASLTKYASGFAGSHNLKFGAEFERSYVKSEQGYPGGMYINASFGVPYYAYLWDGYLKDNVNGRLTGFAQDSWSIGPRFTLSPGVRFDRITGFNKHLDEQVFATNSWAPRIGFAWDVTGNSKTVVRGHYGWYFEGAKSTYYDLLDPQIAPIYGAYIDENLNITDGPYLTKPGTNRIMDDDIKHPRMRQSIIGVERELVPGLSVGVTGIWRKNDHFIDDVLLTPLSEFARVPLPDPGPDGTLGTGDETSTALTMYEQITDPNDNHFLITNPEGAERRYQGVEFTATRRMANNWQFQGSWVIQKVEGNYNNTSATNAGNSTQYNDPNTDPNLQPTLEGRLQNDNTHVAKVLGTYRAPWDILASAAFTYTSGNTFARTVRTRRFTQGRAEPFIEPRGSQRYDGQPQFNFKLEKQFRLSTEGRLGVTFEGFNLFNNAAINSRFTRSGSSYFQPRGVVGPRRFRIGAVYRF
jgi:carboxypeptidase family protein/TonB-dependent receptor-like protein